MLTEQCSIDKERLLATLAKVETYITIGSIDLMLPELQDEVKNLINEVRESNYVK